MATQQHLEEIVATTNNDNNQTVAVKQEVDLNYDNILVKTENEAHDEIDEPTSSYDEIEIHIKEEISNQTDEIDTQEDSVKKTKRRGIFDDLESMIKATKDCYDLSHLDNIEDSTKVTKREVPDDDKINMKHESSNDFVSYDYPNFDDGSMDSNDAAALCQVEACLQDESFSKNDHYNFEVILFYFLN